MWRKLLAASVALVLFAVGAFAAYGWWTRRGTPKFSRGGIWGQPSPTGLASSIPADSPGPEATPVASGPTGATTSSPTSRKLTGQSPTAVASGPTPHAIGPPKSGVYNYQGEGHESGQVGPATACSWNVDKVSLTVKQDPAGLVMDWAFTPNHQQRNILSWRADGAYLTYYGMAVTCMGMRETSEDNYSPPQMWYRFPLKVGDTWEVDSSTENRTEHMVVSVKSAQKVTVPAGEFDTLLIERKVTISGGQSGTYQITHWFAPSLRVSVKEIFRMSAKQGSQSIDSDFSFQLTSLP